MRDQILAIMREMGWAPVTLIEALFVYGESQNQATQNAMVNFVQTLANNQKTTGHW